MQKIIMPAEETKNFLEVFEMFVISQSAKGIADVTIRNYRSCGRNADKKLIKVVQVCSGKYGTFDTKVFII